MQKKLARTLDKPKQISKYSQIKISYFNPNFRSFWTCSIPIQLSSCFHWREFQAGLLYMLRDDIFARKITVLKKRKLPIFNVEQSCINMQSFTSWTIFWVAHKFRPPNFPSKNDALGQAGPQNPPILPRIDRKARREDLLENERTNSSIGISNEIQALAKSVLSWFKFAWLADLITPHLGP